MPINIKNVGATAPGFKFKSDKKGAKSRTAPKTVSALQKLIRKQKNVQAMNPRWAIHNAAVQAKAEEELKAKKSKSQPTKPATPALKPTAPKLAIAEPKKMARTTGGILDPFALANHHQKLRRQKAIRKAGITNSDTIVVAREASSRKDSLGPLDLND